MMKSGFRIILPVMLLIFIFSLPDCFSQAKSYRPLHSHGPGLYDIRKIWNPAWFQGNLRSDNYYEGWYFKIVSHDNVHRYSFIPGIALGEDEHSFIQVINGTTGETEYHRFPLDAFSYSRRGFSVKIGENHFSDKGFSVNLGNGEGGISGQINISGLTHYPVSLLWPGIMGWYRYVPMLETYHGVVSIDHKLSGYLLQGKDTLVFDNGSGYIEKDWGSSMPRAWIWMQSNAFEDQQKASFMLSVAHIPWMGISFTGFLGYLMYGDELYRFATYTTAKLTSVEMGEDDIHVLIGDRGHNLYIKGNKGIRGELMAPIAGEMNRPIHESLDAVLYIRLEDTKGNILFEGSTTQAGLELVGDQNLLQP